MVLISSYCYKKCCRLHGFNNKHLFLYSSVDGVSKPKVLVDLVSFLCDRCGVVFPGSCCPFTWQEEGERVLRGVFYKSTDLTNEGSTRHDLITFQSTHLLIPSHWRPGFQPMNLGGTLSVHCNYASSLEEYGGSFFLIFFFLVLVLAWDKRSKWEYLRTPPDISTNITENLLGARHPLGYRR